jgi:cysteine desulfurase
MLSAMSTPSPAALYLDHAATTPVRPEVRDAMEPFVGATFGNPSGLHATSRAAKSALEDARERVAALLGARHPLDIVFTGGGTESDNLAVAGVALATGGGVVTTAVEHEAVLETARFLDRLGHPVGIVGVDEVGRVDPTALAAAVRPGTSVVSVMAANNETGVRQPIVDIVGMVRSIDPDIVIHSDAVQAMVSEEVTLEALGVDLITLAAHKFGGPKGVGLLHVRRDLELEPVLHGGGQEMGRRSGTHNVAGIVGMAAAMQAAVDDRDRFRSDVAAARDSFEHQLIASIPDVEFTVPRDVRLVQHSHFRIPGIDAETLLIRLDGLGVAASAGSACQSGAIEMSHVLDAMGVDATSARQAVRFTFGWTTQVGDGAAAASAVIEAVGGLR